MTQYSWYLNKKRMMQIEELKKLPDHHDISIHLEYALDEYLRKHSSGNPTFKLDNWKDPDFKPFPALASNYNTWCQFIDKLNKNELEELRGHIIKLDNAWNRKRRW